MQSESKHAPDRGSRSRARNEYIIDLSACFAVASRSPPKQPAHTHETQRKWPRGGFPHPGGSGSDRIVVTRPEQRPISRLLGRGAFHIIMLEFSTYIYIERACGATRSGSFPDKADLFLAGGFHVKRRSNMKGEHYNNGNTGLLSKIYT